MRPWTAGRFSRDALLLGVSLLLILASSSDATTDSGMGDAGGEGSGPFTGLAQSPEANLFTGAMSMSVPILIPPARKNATPALNLAYSSAAGASPFGLGWDVPLGAISRSTKFGVPRCDGNATDEFVLELPGGAVELGYVSTEGAYRLYRPRIDEAYLEAHAYTSANRWEVFDQRGAKFVFGDSETARVATSLPSVFLEPPPACNFTTGWALTRIEDPNGNTIDLTYFKGPKNGLYPEEILYGANPGAGLPDHPFRVRFCRSGGSCRIPAPYPVTSYRSGVEVVLDELISEIQVQYWTVAS